MYNFINVISSNGTNLSNLSERLDRKENGESDLRFYCSNSWLLLILQRI